MSKALRPIDEVRSSRLALLGLSLSMLMASLATSVVNAGLPTLARAFNASFQQVQWIVLSYLLAVTALIVGAGRLGDIVGRRRLLLIGLSCFTVASVLCGAAPSLWALIAARAAQGLGAAVMMALTIAFAGETVPKERMGSAMGLLGTMSAIGTALGPPIGGLLISGVGWRAMFLVNVPVGIAALYLSHRSLPAAPQDSRLQRAAFDLPGTTLLALTLGTYSLAMTLGRGNFGSLNSALLGATIIGGCLFVYVQGRTPSPLLDLATFKDRVQNGSLIASGLVATVMMSTLVVGPFYLSRALNLDAGTVGIVLSVGPLVVALIGVPAGRLRDHFGAERIAMVGLGMIATGASLLSLTRTEQGISGFVFPMVVVTAGYGLFQTSNNTMVMAGVPLDQRWVVSGLLGLSRNLGLVTGASAMGTVFAFASGATDVASAAPSSVAAGMRFTFAVATVLTLVALGVAFASRSASLSLKQRNIPDAA